jgi:hydroxymethylbilane synthase
LKLIVNNFPHLITLGTRGSGLARWQTEYVASLLKNVYPALAIRTELITTRGDQVLDKPLPLIGGKGVFTAELEVALNRHEIDFAVHSLKDLPTENPSGLTLGAIPLRGSAGDALVSRDGYTLDTLPQGAAVGTSSRRRASQLLYRRPDLRMIEIRGNVDTRLRQALDENGDYDAIVLALAGLERLGLTQYVSQKLSLDDMLPAPGQGALAVQCRDKADVIEWLSPINHEPTKITVTAERAFLAGLGGGCSLPIAAYAAIEGDTLWLRGRVTAPDGSEQVDVTAESAVDVQSASELGANLADKALASGVARLLAMLP